jgi:hypothetical protein
MHANLSRLVSTINNAAPAPEGWSEVLNLLMQAARVAGAAYIVRDRATGKVDWACFSGLSAEFKSDYIRQYAALDPYAPLLNETWAKLSECLPEAVLRRSEWYNDFVLKCGVRDILATRLIDTESHSVILGLHQQIGRTFPDDTASILSVLSDPLKRAALCHAQQLASAKAGTLKNPRIGRRAVGAIYHFHLRNGCQYPDKTGSIFPTPGEAIAHAAVLAAELRQDEGWDRFAIHVANEHGEEVALVPIRP